MPVGAGLYGAGTAPAGYGIPDQAPFSPTSPLIDPATGLSQTGRLIDQQTKDYVFTADGRLQGMPTVRQLVLLAITDIDLSTLTEKGPNFAATLTTLVQNALASLITRKLVLLKQVTVLQPSSDSGIAVANWVDLTNGEPVETPIGP